MTARNLKLSQTNAFSVIHVPMAQIARWWDEGVMRATAWQRAPRWKSGKDDEEWIACALQNTPIVPLFAHQRERTDGTLEYCIIDGQNRTKACHAFLIERSIAVRAGDVLRRSAAPDARMGFADFSAEQQRAIESLLVPMCVFHPDTTEGELRRVFLALNRGKMLTSCEIIRSWTHVPIVNDVLNVVDERLAPRVQAVAPRWRAQNHRMMHTWVKIAAMIASDGLYLPKADRLQQWVACRTGPVPPAQAERIACVADRVVRVVEGWHGAGSLPALVTLADLAWAIDYYLTEQNEPALLHTLVHPLRVGVHNEVDQAELWSSHAGSAHINSVRARRAYIALVVGRELGLDEAPAEFARAASEQPSNNTVLPGPSAEDLGAAHALFSLLPRPQPPPRPESLGAWTPTY